MMADDELHGCGVCGQIDRHLPVCPFAYVPAEQLAGGDDD